MAGRSLARASEAGTGGGTKKNRPLLTLYPGMRAAPRTMDEPSGALSVWWRCGGVRASRHRPLLGQDLLLVGEDLCLVGLDRLLVLQQLHQLGLVALDRGLIGEDGLLIV